VNEGVYQIWGCVWITVVGELWNHKNKSIFRNGMIDHIEIFTMAQLKVWSWIKFEARGVSFSYSNWCLESLVCMRNVKKY